MSLFLAVVLAASPVRAQCPCAAGGACVCPPAACPCGPALSPIQPTAMLGPLTPAPFPWARTIAPAAPPASALIWLDQGGGNYALMRAGKQIGGLSSDGSYAPLLAPHRWGPDCAPPIARPAAPIARSRPSLLRAWVGGWGGACRGGS